MTLIKISKSFDSLLIEFIDNSLFGVRVFLRLPLKGV